MPGFNALQQCFWVSMACGWWSGYRSGFMGKQLSQSDLESMHLLNRKPLIKASVLLGAYCSANHKPAELKTSK